MFKINIKYSIYTIIIFLNFNLFSLQKSSDFFSQNNINTSVVKELLENNEVTFYHEVLSSIRFSYLNPKLQNRLEIIKKNNPKLIVESIFYVNWESQNFGGNDDAKILFLYNTMRKLSSIEGIQYYSASRDTLRTLFKKFYPVASDGSKKKIEDPIVSSLVESQRVFVFQEDLTFGENFLELDYLYDPASKMINLSMVNLRSMKYYIPLVSSRGFTTDITVIALEDGVIFYSLGTVNAVAASLKKDSFYNRSVAMFNWFKSNLNN